MRLYLDTSTKKTILKLDDTTYEWDSGHDLAEKLLSFIKDKLKENGKSWQDLEEITFMSGPGSFTGLRIGASVVNTLNAFYRNHYVLNFNHSQSVKRTAFYRSSYRS